VEWRRAAGIRPSFRAHTHLHLSDLGTWQRPDGNRGCVSGRVAFALKTGHESAIATARLQPPPGIAACAKSRSNVDMLGCTSSQASPKLCSPRLVLVAWMITRHLHRPSVDCNVALWSTCSKQQTPAKALGLFASAAALRSYAKSEYIYRNLTRLPLLSRQLPSLSPLSPRFI
jgi:hypothetical protein